MTIPATIEQTRLIHLKALRAQVMDKLAILNEDIGNIKRKKYLIGQIAALKQAMESARHITYQDRDE